MPLPSGGKYRFRKGTDVRLHFNKSGDVDEVKKFGKKGGKGKGKGKSGSSSGSSNSGKTKGKMQAEALRNGGE